MANQLTESLEDYLEAIAELIETEGHAHSKEIAQKLHVKMPSVTSALRQLERSGYILYQTHYPVVLTPAGKAIADEVIQRHRILKMFFSGILGLPVAKASETACRLEHIVDADTIRRFILFSDAIEKRCDARCLQKYLAEAISMIGDPNAADFQLLCHFSGGDKVKITKIGGNLDGCKLPECLNTGNVVSIEGPTLDKSSFQVRFDDALIDLPFDVAENVWGVAVK